MAIGDDNAIWGPPVVTTAEVENLVLRATEIVCEVGPYRLRLGDGVTPGGKIIGEGTGPGTGGGPAFKTIAVTGADPSNYVNAESVDDILTLTGIRGFVITPNASTDTISFGFAHGGAIGNVPTWNGEAYVPSEPADAQYVPQEGFADTNLLIESADRKFWDGRIELDYYASPDNPPSTVELNGETLPSLSASAANYLRSVPKRVPYVTFENVYFGMRLKTSATSGSVRISAKIDRITDIAASPTYGTAVVADYVVPAGATDFEVELDLGTADSLVPGSMFRTEFGRVGENANDTAAQDCILVEAWVRVV